METKDLATQAPINLNIWRNTRAIFETRRQLGLLDAGETVNELYQINVKWLLEGTEKYLDAEKIQTDH